MHSNSLPLLGISTPKIFTSNIQILPIHINLGVLIRKGNLSDTFSLNLNFLFAARDVFKKCTKIDMDVI